MPPEHWNARVRTTNDYPRALEVTPSHPLFPAAQQGRIPVVNLSGRLSSSARRRLRRTIKETTGSNIATCHTPLPDERASWTIGGPSATPATPSVRPVVEHLSLAERWERSKLLSPAERGELYSLLSPAEQEEWFKLFVEDRRSQVALARRTTNLEEETLGLSRGASSGRSVTARQLSALPVVASNNDIFYWHNYGLVSRPRGLQAGGPADVSALESSWALMTPIDPTTAIDTCDTDLELLSTITDPSDVAETARHASRLLDAFSSGNIEGPLSSTQQRLLSTALTSILALTHDRVDTAAQTDPLPPPVDAAAQTDPLPPPVDVSMRPDATCVVCFSRLVDTVLMPCWHLVLCGVRRVLDSGFVGRG